MNYFSKLSDFTVSIAPVMTLACFLIYSFLISIFLCSKLVFVVVVFMIGNAKNQILICCISFVVQFLSNGFQFFFGQWIE